MSKLNRILVSMLLLFQITLADELMNLSDAIKISKQQEILIQKMIKNYIMIGMNNRYGDPKSKLENIIIEFEKNMQALDDFATSKVAFKNIEDVSKGWEKVNSAIKKSKTIEELKNFIPATDTLAKFCKKTSKIYTRQTGVSMGELIDSTTNLEITAQRMAVLYLLKSWGDTSPYIQKQMSASLDTFEVSSKKLSNSKLNTPDMEKSLYKIEKSFRYFKVMDKLDNKTIPTLIYKKSNDILEDARHLGELYSKAIILN